MLVKLFDLENHDCSFSQSVCRNNYYILCQQNYEKNMVHKKYDKEDLRSSLVGEFVSYILVDFWEQNSEDLNKMF